MPRAPVLLLRCVHSRSPLLIHCFCKPLFQKAFATHFGPKYIGLFDHMTRKKDLVPRGYSVQ